MLSHMSTRKQLGVPSWGSLTQPLGVYLQFAVGVSETAARDFPIAIYVALRACDGEMSEID